MVWKRPDSVPFPSVWARFKGRKPMADGKIPNFTIQDIPGELRDRTVDYMCQHFIRQEPMCQSTNAAADKETEKDLRIVWYQALDNRIALICLVEDEDGNVPENPVIAGINITAVATKDDKNEFRGTPLATNMLGALSFAINAANVFERFGVDEYMMAYGLSVSEEFRGQNIGYELLKARFPLCKAVGLKLTGTAFTSVVSQHLAKKCGYEECYEVSFKDLAEKHNINVNKKTDTIKFMVYIV